MEFSAQCSNDRASLVEGFTCGDGFINFKDEAPAHVFGVLGRLSDFGRTSCADLMSGVTVRNSAQVGGDINEGLGHPASQSPTQN